MNHELEQNHYFILLPELWERLYYKTMLSGKTQKL